MAGENEHPRQLVHWRGLVRLVLGAAVAAAVLLSGAAVLVLASGRPIGEVAPFVGIVVVALLGTVVLAVAWSALRGMLRAGDVGERLGSKDVGFLPPQARRRGHGRSRRDEP